MAPHYVPLPPYATAPITTLLAPHPPHHQGHQPHQTQAHPHHSHPHHSHPHPQQHPHPHSQLHQSNPFAFSHYHTSNTTNVVAPFSSNPYIQTRPSLGCHIPSDNNVVRGIPFCRPPRSGFIIDDHHTQSTPTKQEPGWTPPSEPTPFPPPAPTPSSSQVIKTSPSSSRCATEEASFGTDVDTLMKAIQSKAMTSTPSQSTTHIAKIGSGVGSPLTLSLPLKPYHLGESNSSKLTHSGLQEEASHPKANKKRYQCTIQGCTKSFFQKTHLDIHERAHTGVKPYSCKQPGCDRTFSQLGNLKTHERRHTGERPYQCETCGKRFAQRGNVRAHKIVHDQSKPYICKLDDCGKQFTQLGNLKSHQNKFHITTLRALTTKFASIQEGDTVHAADRELWEYFANLYKNSNKGIKGRGKDRKVGTSLMMSSMRNVGVSRSEGYGMSGTGSGNMVVNLNVNVAPHSMGRPNTGNTYNVYDDVVSSSGSGGASSVSTCYEDAPSDTFDETGRTGEMSFSEQRIY